ncbi:MAG: flagellar assembly protein FliX [Alphaproteobacteria bacterium]|nr:flagellar assembly protein FliX [Alphaproteobacteria bacterium]
MSLIELRQDLPGPVLLAAGVESSANPSAGVSYADENGYGKAMKIDGPGSSGKVGPSKKTSKSSGAKGAGFSEALRGSGDGKADDAAGVSGGAGLSSVGALLALQGIEETPTVDPDEKKRNRAAVDRGEELLERLDEIRIALLQGSIPRQRLLQIRESLARRGDSAANPQLAALINDIELRVEVELAKHGNGA